jgi:FG-GAP-like repeat/ASPIC and UnbV
MIARPVKITRNEFFVVIAIAVTTVVLVKGLFDLYVKHFDPDVDSRNAPAPAASTAVRSASPSPGITPLENRTYDYKPRIPMDTSGFSLIAPAVERWEPDASLAKIAESWKQPGLKAITKLDEYLRNANANRNVPPNEAVRMLLVRATLFNCEGLPKRTYESMVEARALLEQDRIAARELLYTVIYFQGVAAMRRGENENCIDCRGESSCILPISEAAVHKVPTGSRLAIGHFTEYLERFPDDLEVRWLLNVAHMTLGEHPSKVDPRFLISLERFRNSEFNIGKFRDIGHLTGVNRFNQAGGAVMEDFDNDGRLDLAVTSFDPTEPLSLYRNKGDGHFEERSEAAGVKDQLGGLFCVQTDYNNDGHMDVYIPRGAWLPMPMRPSLLRNNGNGTFSDVTEVAGLLDPVNSNSACWADYDNDGWLDLFVCCERQSNRLYHNRKDGTFEDVSARAGLQNENIYMCKGANWIDFDNDDYPDLFVNNLNGSGQLYRNNHDGTFTSVTSSMGINGPRNGFSCWAWDYDNDGWLDIFATCYDRTLKDVVKGLIGQPHERSSNKLFRNVNGKKFVDMTQEAGLDAVFATMGSNFADFDGDGYLDMYLATGEPSFATLIPNRMFKNVGGQRFAEITGTSGTGHLQKGHGVACGDWDRDGDIDLFVETGGAVNGDKFHNLHFQNPGQGNHWLTVKLVGKKSNRAAIGARIKIVTAGDAPLTVHRHVSSGSSFGANPLEQTIGLAKSKQVALLEVHWPSSGTTQVFRDIPVDQALEITEFAKDYRPLERKPIPAPAE